jgi:LysM repeat protein
VARKAATCFFCGSSLTEVQRRRLSIPWADLVLFAVIGAVVAAWWLRAPTPDSGRPSAFLGMRVAGPANATPAQVALAVERQAPLSGRTPAAEAGIVEVAPTEAGEQTAEPSPTPTPIPAPSATPPSSPARHTVKRGETLQQIAGLYDAQVKDIIDANGLNAQGFIRAGQELLIPQPGPSGGPGPTSTPGDTLIYTVQSGDTLSGIAAKFGSQVDWIVNANKINPGDFLRISQVVIVPRTGATPTPAPTATPLVSNERRPTSTPGYRVPAPLTPADGATVSGETVLLAWTSVGVLGREEWYVLTLKSPKSGAALQSRWTKQTSWRLPSELRGTEMDWQVQVCSGSPEQPGEPLSPPSAERSLTWR